MESRKPRNKFNLRVSTLNFESRDTSKLSCEDLESTRDKFTPLTSPFLEIRDYSLQTTSSPFDRHNKTICFPLQTAFQSGSPCKLNEESRSVASIGSQPSHLISQKPSIEMWDVKLNRSWGVPACLAKGFELVSEIGKGRQGTVCLLREMATERLIAGKILAFSDEESKASITNEISILNSLSHPNIVQFYDSCFDEETSSFWLLMEYFPSISLLQMLKEAREMTEGKIRLVMWQLLNAVAHIHAKNVCHRDLNLENVLIDYKDLTVKIIDFGVSKKLEEPSTLMFSAVGNLNYRAPEYCEFKGYSLSYDIWQLGLIFAQMVKREIFSTKKAMKYREAILKDETIDHNGRELLRRMLEIDSSRRIGIQEALKSKWFDGFCC